MADANLASLCVQTVHAHFGPLAARVTDALLTRGRLTLAQLVRYASLKPRTARACVLALVQHNLLWHTHVPGEGDVLELNTDACLARLRFGRYVAQADALFGHTGAEIVQIVLDHGKLTSPDILARLGVKDAKTTTLYTQTLHKLVAQHYLSAALPASHQSPRDKLLAYDAEERAKLAGLATAKQLAEARVSAEERLRRDDRAAEKVGLVTKTVEEPRSKSNKRKLVEMEVVDNEVYFRINYERFNVHIRNKLIEDAARDRFNEGAAQVMRALLKATEDKQTSLADPATDPTSVADIVALLPASDALGAGLQTLSARPSTMALAKEYLGLLACADNPTPAGRAGAFVSVGSGGGKAQAALAPVAAALRQRALERAARERYGDGGLRVLRLLLGAGKTDERALGARALMAPKDVRPLLSAMAADGVISMQEVPKSADRNPSRMFYLWFVDLKKAYSVLLGRLYKTQYNIASRRRAEGEDALVRAVLDKRARTDVALDEGLLTRNEREVLAEYDSRCEHLTVLEARVDEAVFVLRELTVASAEEE